MPRSLRIEYENFDISTEIRLSVRRQLTIETKIPLVEKNLFWWLEE